MLVLLAIHQPLFVMERKLVAIFSADVQGYSRLMGDDEEVTVRTLTEYRGIVASLIQQHRGRVIDSPGDNLLAEFVSVVEQVPLLLSMQQYRLWQPVHLPKLMADIPR